MENPKKVLWSNMNLLSITGVSNGESYKLQLGFRNGFPRFIITEISEEFKPSVTVSSTIIMIEFIVEAIRNVIDGKKDKYTIDFKNNKFVDNKRTDEIEVHGTITIEKSDTFILMSINTRDRTYKFPLVVDNVYFAVNGNDTQSLESNMMLAKAYARLLSSAVSTYTALMTYHRHTTERDK